MPSLFHNEKRPTMPLQPAQQETLPARSSTAPIRRSSTLSRVKRFGSMLVRTNPSSKKKPAVQDIFPPPPSITTPIDETGPRCSSQTSLSTTDDDEEKVLDTPTFDVAPATVNHTHGNQDVCVPPLLPLQPIELETLPVKKWSLNPTTTLVRSELLRTFEQVDTELELELDLKRSQMIQSLNTRPRHVF